MRHLAIALASASLLPLAACGSGGSGVESLGSVTPPKVDVGTLTPSPTPATTTASNLLDVTAATDYTVVGGLQSLKVDANSATLYAGNATTVGNTVNKINYSPRDGVFMLTLADTNANVTRNVRYQDPAHRTAEGLEREIPSIREFNYLVALDGSANATFFYQRPGTTGAQYVSLAGFARTEVNTATGERLSEHGAFVFGTKTAPAQVPITGGGTYAGNFLASMVGTKFNEGGHNPALQWLLGSSTVTVDFAKATVNLALNGQVLDAAVNNIAIDNATLNLPGGSTFDAAGSAKIDYLRSSGFTGTFSSAKFTVAGREVPVTIQGVTPGSNVAGASSIDGTFYGPNAVNVGGGFRIIGGTPDQRVDILGGFNGAK